MKYFLKGNKYANSNNLGLNYFLNQFFMTSAISVSHRVPVCNMASNGKFNLFANAIFV